MLFQSQVFVLFFLPIVFAGFWLLSRSAPTRLTWLILASLVFYGWWDYRFIPLILFHVFSAAWLANLAVTTGRKRWIDFAIALQLGSLAWWKYAFFLGEQVALVGLEIRLPAIVLPIAISFYTFQLVSYLLDLRRGHPPEKTTHLLAYIAFFPQLIAGPIVRHNDLIPQLLDNPWRDGWEKRLSAGLFLYLLGFIKKVFFADSLAPLVDNLFLAAEQSPLGMIDAWWAAIMFSLQIFLDFAAYSEMAIGLALIFGVVLPENFFLPYRARNIREFWRRWHITLSNFFRDYLYIPLGGNRNGLTIQVGAVMTTMLLCGLWHGAGWTFVIWGGLHGVALAVVAVMGRAELRAPLLISWSLTMLFLAFTWVIFRAPDMGVALDIIASMVGINGYSGAPTALSLVGLAGLVAILCPSSLTIYRRWPVMHPAIQAAPPLAVIYLLVMQGSVPAPFVYFQF